jgi:hypothetical protein
MSNDDYRSRTDFYSRSYLHAVAKGGGAAQRWLDLGHDLVPFTNSIKIGNAFDRLIEGVCRGKSVDSMIQSPPPEVLAKDGSRRGKAYEAWKAENENNGAIDCNEDMAFQLRSMVESLLANDDARPLVESTIETQVSAFFEVDGHLVKVRPDAGCRHLWWDIKTTSSPWDRLHKSAADYGYCEQEWLYVAGAKALGMDHFRMPFVFTQTFAPYMTEVYYMPEDLVSAAGVRLRNTMAIAKLRQVTGEYQPASQGIKELVFPKYTRSIYEEELDDQDDE